MYVEQENFRFEMQKECKTCIFGDTVARCCGYLLKTGRSRIAMHGGDYRQLQNGPRKERVPGKPLRPKAETFTFPWEKEERR